ncbi:MAG: histidine--tRNA ligase [Acidimicrobiia bacterium]|nr:histidine--tRNA ligase [Acidimicrobiia bacterium]
MPTFQTSPGMRDILPPESGRWRRFNTVFAELVEAAGYGLLIPPLLEDLSVFTRLGDATDVVTKEMYDFVDKGDRHVALRPEMTAGVCRAFAQHRPTPPWKTWYTGSNFRYEKPQRGRYRQFDQVGVEVLGADDAQVDVEVIALASEFYSRLGLRQVRLIVNSLGEPGDRALYVDALRRHFDAAGDALSPESRDTLTRNPLRILDSKREADRVFIDTAPRISEFHGDDAAAHFAEVCAGLRDLDIPFEVEPKLVRGLDYYLRTIFEFQGGTLDSAQNALGGGGRYDGLVEALGGPPTPGVGFALGIERTLLACDDEGVFAAAPHQLDAFVVDVTGGGEATRITAALRAAGFTVDRGFDNRSMKAQMKLANRSAADAALIVGEDELAAGTIVVKPLRSDDDQITIPRTELIEHLTGTRADDR